MAKKLKRTSSGDVVLPSGETISVKEQKALRSAVNSANRIRKRLIDQLPDVAKKKYSDFGAMNEFHIRKKSKSLSRFENKKQFEAYLKTVKHITSGEFEHIAVANMMNNYIKALHNTYGSRAMPIVNIILQMTPKQFKYYVDSEQIQDINYIYHESEIDENERLINIMVSALNIKNNAKLK